MAIITDKDDANVGLQISANGAASVARRGASCRGSYKLALMSGLTTVLAANGEVLQFRWTDPTIYAVLRYLRVRMQVVTGFTAAQELSFEACRVSGFTAAGSGGTVISPGAADFKKFSSMPTSVLNEVRIATTAVLGAGTKTIESPFLCNSIQELAAAATVPRAQGEAVYRPDQEADQAHTFLADEGFIVRNSILMGAAGTVRWNIEAAWDEFLISDYTP